MASTSWDKAKPKRRPKVVGRDLPGVNENYGPKAMRSGSMAGTMQRIHKENAPEPEKLYLPGGRTSARQGNNRINLKAVAEVLAEKGLDPTVALVDIIQSGTLPPDIQARVLGTLMEYVHSKKKSVEITGADGGAIQVENVTDDVLMRIAMKAIPEEITDVDDKAVS